MVYELFALFAVAFVAAVPWVALLPEHVVGPGNPLFQLYLLLAFKLYFVICWRTVGQTLGMRAWRLCVLTTDDQLLGWKQAMLRYWVSILSWLPLGMGYWWLLFDPQRQAWHDRAAGSQVVLLEKWKK